MMRLFLLFFLLSALALKSQESFIYFGSEDLTKLDSNWRFTTQDKPEFKEVAFNDSLWTPMRTQLFEKEREKAGFKGIGWFRLHLKLNPALDSIPLSLYMVQEGASEIYIDGKKIKEFGVIGTSENNQQRYTPENEIIFFHPKFDREIVIAIRYSNYSYEHSFDKT
ncbi:MAG: hypothetical protein IAF38_18500, partial [Bacteroidia bacterium]|nr:hypothetical protein [Bacteroidia bacterium]